MFARLRRAREAGIGRASRDTNQARADRPEPAKGGSSDEHRHSPSTRRPADDRAGREQPRARPRSRSGSGRLDRPSRADRPVARQPRRRALQADRRPPPLRSLQEPRPGGGGDHAARAGGYERRHRGGERRTQGPRPARGGSRCQGHARGGLHPRRRGNGARLEPEPRERPGAAPRAARERTRSRMRASVFSNAAP